MALVLRDAVLQAGDAAADDQFGESVALSADGSVLVIGAVNRSGQGGVYTYDLVDGAWVQRGSVLAAGDAAAGDLFGHAVALSGDGLVLAVGAVEWEGGTSNQGGVYLYDRSGSSWVQRGSVMVSPAPSADGWFGSGVALSSDGAILAVGEAYFTGTYTDQGCVRIYDWNGSSWSQRGSNIVSSQAADRTNFGQAVALSGDGLVLAVWTFWYGVEVFDWSGSAWVQRGTELYSADWHVDDQFGYAIALSDDGARMVVGARAWEGSLTNQGTAYVYDWNGSSWGATETIVADDAVANDFFGNGVAVSADGSIVAAGAPRRDAGATLNTGGVYVFAELQIGTPTAPTTLTVVRPTGVSAAPTTLTVQSVGTPVAPTTLAVISASHVPTWRARCLIDGVDKSTRMVGQASVTAAEGAARIATVTLLPESGTIEPLDYVGKTLTLDYVLVIGGTEVPRRLFTGRIDTPAYDPATTLLTLQCTDDLQNIVAGLPRGTLDAIIGGRYAEAVQGEIDDNWDYAQARMSTVAGSFDASPNGGLRVTAWDSATVWATLDDGDLLYHRMGLTLPQRSTLVNKVDVAFDYRYARLRQRYTTVGWSGTQIDMRPNGWQYPTQQDILGACNGSGWTATLGVFYPAPTAVPYPGGGFIYPPAGSIDMAIVYLTQRHTQTVTETYTLTVTATESVAANGELPHALRGALASSFDGAAWESALDVEPLMATGGEQDYAPDATRSDANHAIRTLLDQARVKILGSHRSARLSNAVLCNPDLDLDKRIAIDTGQVQAEGKVAELRHVLDFEAGSALTEFSLAISGVGGAGLITPDALDPPDPPEAANATQEWAGSTPSLWVNNYGVTPYTENLMGLLLNVPETITVQDVPGEGTVVYANPYYTAGSYPVEGFRVRMPGVDATDRNPIEKPVSHSYQIIVPEDTLSFTIP